MLRGYARVSTNEQDLSIQIAELKSAGCNSIYQEKISGAKKERPELKRLLEDIQEADTLIVCKLDRLARSTHQLLEIVEILGNKKAKFRSLGEPWADTTSPAGKMIMTVFAGIAEFERELIRERTSLGREAAMQKGIKFGRKRKLTEAQLTLIPELQEQGKSVKEIAQVFGCDRSTIYRALNRMDENNN